VGPIRRLVGARGTFEGLSLLDGTRVVHQDHGAIIGHELSMNVRPPKPVSTNQHPVHTGGCQLRAESWTLHGRLADLPVLLRTIGRTCGRFERINCPYPVGQFKFETGQRLWIHVILITGRLSSSSECQRNRTITCAASRVPHDLWPAPGASGDGPYRRRCRTTHGSPWNSSDRDRITVSDQGFGSRVVLVGVQRQHTNHLSVGFVPDGEAVVMIDE